MSAISDRKPAKVVGYIRQTANFAQKSVIMISRQIIKEIIIEGQERIPSLSLIRRATHLDNNTNYVFVGLRRAGKSYTIYQNIAERLERGENTPQEILYVNFEDDRLDGFEVGDFQSIIKTYGELFPSTRPVVYLDEVQIVDGWEKFVRRLADQDYRVYVTGSNAKMLSKEIATTLGGRFVTREIYPFSFFEYLQYKGVELNENWEYSNQQSVLVRHHFDDYFYYGGFAENINKSNKREWLNILMKKILLGDIVMRNKIREPNNILLLTKKLAESVMQPSSQSHLCNILKSTGSRITRETMVDYLSEMRDAYLIFQLKNYMDSFVEKSLKNKTYFFDNGLLFISTADANTKLLENLVAIHLYKKYGENETDGLFYYNKNVEVDFYVPEDKMAIQVSYNLNGAEDTFNREVKSLIELNKYQHTERSLIITMDDEREVEIDGVKIEIVPIWKWLLKTL